MTANPNLHRFLYISSQSAAGPSKGAEDFRDEARLPQPLNWYSRSKLAGEEALLSMGDRLPLTIIRPSAIFGPRDRDFFAYFHLVKWHLELKLGQADRWYSFIYVRDLVELILLALENGIALGQTYFGSGPAHTYAELSETIGRAMDKRVLRIPLPEAILTPIALGAKVQERLTGRPALLNEQRVRDMRQAYWLCSGEKARRELGFTARYTLEAAIQETADWYRETGWL